MTKCPICHGVRWITVKKGKPMVACFKCNPDGNVPRDPSKPKPA